MLSEREARKWTAELVGVLLGLLSERREIWTGELVGVLFSLLSERHENWTDERLVGALPAPLSIKPCSLLISPHLVFSSKLSAPNFHLCQPPTSQPSHFLVVFPPSPPSPWLHQRRLRPRSPPGEFDLNCLVGLFFWIVQSPGLMQLGLSSLVNRQNRLVCVGFLLPCTPGMISLAKWHDLENPKTLKTP